MVSGFKFLLALQLLLAKSASRKWILLAIRNFHSPLASWRAVVSHTACIFFNRSKLAKCKKRYLLLFSLIESGPQITTCELLYWYYQNKNRIEDTVLMAYIYGWSPEGVSLGHASMLLKDSGVYISWWPKDDKEKHMKKKKKVDTKEHLPQNYDEDVADFIGREYTHKFDINSVKIKCDVVASWWRNARGGGGYNFFKRNCCDVVYDALEKGGCFEWVHPGIKFVSTPKHMIRYARKLENATCIDDSRFKKCRII